MVKLTRGERFKDARIVHNIHKKQTMDDVSAATGVGKSTIQALEDDNIERSVGYDKVAKLASHYHVTTDYLLGLTDDPSPTPNAVDELGLPESTIRYLAGIKQSENKELSQAVYSFLNSEDFPLFIYQIHLYFAAKKAAVVFDYVSKKMIEFTTGEYFVSSHEYNNGKPRQEVVHGLLDFYDEFEKKYTSTVYEIAKSGKYDQMVSNALIAQCQMLDRSEKELSLFANGTSEKTVSDFSEYNVNKTLWVLLKKMADEELKNVELPEIDIASIWKGEPNGND